MSKLKGFKEFEINLNELKNVKGGQEPEWCYPWNGNCRQCFYGMTEPNELGLSFPIIEPQCLA